ncbi:hypothetical protein R3I94_021450 [Phoxinus phoxinus]
MFNTKGVVKKV